MIFEYVVLLKKKKSANILSPGNEMRTQFVYPGFLLSIHWPILLRTDHTDKNFTLTSHLTYKSLSHVWLFVTPWTVVRQAPLSMKFSRQEYRSGFPFSSPRGLPNPEIEPGSPKLQEDLYNLSQQASPNMWGRRIRKCKFFFLFLECVWAYLTNSLKQADM